MYLKPRLKDLSRGSRISFVRQFREITQDELADKLKLKVERKRRTITNYENGIRSPKDDRLLEISNILNARINTIKEYVMNINIQLKFSNKVDSIFDDYRLRTDTYLVDNLPSGTKKLSSIYSRLKENDEESYSQASTSRRKLIREFTDDLFKKIYPDNTLKKI